MSDEHDAVVLSALSSAGGDRREVFSALKGTLTPQEVMKALRRIDGSKARERASASPAVTAEARDPHSDHLEKLLAAAESIESVTVRGLNPLM